MFCFKFLCTYDCKKLDLLYISKCYKVFGNYLDFVKDFQLGKGYPEVLLEKISEKPFFIKEK